MKKVSKPSSKEYEKMSLKNYFSTMSSNYGMKTDLRRRFLRNPSLTMFSKRNFFEIKQVWRRI